MEAAEEYIELSIVVERTIVDWLASLVPQYQEQYGDDFTVNDVAGAELQSLYCLCEIYGARNGDALSEAILERGVQAGADAALEAMREVQAIRKGLGLLKAEQGGS